jgi:hypothetical protein
MYVKPAKYSRSPGVHVQAKLVWSVLSAMFGQKYSALNFSNNGTFKWRV